MTKIDILSGFLGAGKTTLIKKLLQEAIQGEKVVLIENEFGEIGIDGGFLRDAGIEISEMNSGCICCSLVGDFGAALHKVQEQFHPDRILIEPSGVGKLSDVTRAVVDVAQSEPEMVLGSAVTVADATKCRSYMKNFGEFYNNQVENAGTIVLSRTQKMTQEKLAEAVELLRQKNPRATIITTPWDALDGRQILAAMEKTNDLTAELMEELRWEREEDNRAPGENCGCSHHDHHHSHDAACHKHHGHHEHDESCACSGDGHGQHHHSHHADEVFSSWGVETPRPFTEAEIRCALEELDSGKYGVVLRAKGIVPTGEGQWLHFDFVPGDMDIRRGAADVTGRLCVIGSHLSEESLKSLFRL